MVSLETGYGIARMSIDAPPLNILTRDVLRAVRDALTKVAADSTTRVLLLQAAGRHFSAGASVEEHLPPECVQMIGEFMDTVSALREFGLPTVAAVQGRCLGGAFELIQAVDMVVAAESAQFGQPEVHLGVFAPAACALLPGRIGPARAAELLFTGDAMTAHDARAAGLVARVAPDERVHEAAEALAQQIARHSAATLRAMKKALLERDQQQIRSALSAAARTYLDELMHTHDALEGLQAFTAKRSPQWSHQ